MFFGTMGLVGMSVITQKGTTKIKKTKNFIQHTLVNRIKPTFSEPLTTTEVTTLITTDLTTTKSSAVQPTFSKPLTTTEVTTSTTDEMTTTQSLGVGNKFC